LCGAQWHHSGTPSGCGVEPSSSQESSARGFGRPAQSPPIPPHPPWPPDRAQPRLLRSAPPAWPREPQSARGRGGRELPGGPSDRARDPPSRPGHRRRRHHRGAGPGPGAGRRAGAALFPASPEASLALRWERSLRVSRLGWHCGEETGQGGGWRQRWRWRRQWGTDLGWGPRRNAPPRPLPLQTARPPAGGTGFRTERGKTPGLSWGGGRPCRLGAASGGFARYRGPRPDWRSPWPWSALAAPGRWPRPYRTLIRALRSLMAGRDTRSSPGPAWDRTDRGPRYSTWVGVSRRGCGWGRAGHGSSCTLGSGPTSGNFNYFGFHSPPHSSVN
jgi:hypothetical protein